MTYNKSMYYYFVWVRSNRYHGHEALTYSAHEHLVKGSIVQVELQKELVLGIVVGLTTQPRFQTKIITRIFGLPPLPAHLLRLSVWLQDYYPAPFGIIAQQLLPAHLSEKVLESSLSEQYDAPNLGELPPLTAEQCNALKSMQKPDTYILHGTTGSGKTRVYIELAALSINSGKSAIVLTPEISLTTQLADSFRQVFGKRVIVMHSRQTPLDRQKAWLWCLKSPEPIVMIGPRSALFSPVHKLGLIVLDEAHEGAYKQEQAPQYQTGRVAAFLSSLERSTLVLGSATPAVSDYYLAEQKNKPIITLAKLAPAGPHPAAEVIVVDRKDHSLFNRSPFLSQELVASVEEALGRGEQSLLYLNRRGTARMVLCENCGWQALCPHCDIPLTYHGDQHQLRCHSCSHHQSSPTR